MRISRAKLIVLIALIVVIVVELRTVLAFFDVEVSIPLVIGLGVAAIVTLVVWAVFTAPDAPDSG